MYVTLSSVALSAFSILTAEKFMNETYKLEFGILHGLYYGLYLVYVAVLIAYYKNESKHNSRKPEVLAILFQVCIWIMCFTSDLQDGDKEVK